MAMTIFLAIVGTLIAGSLVLHWHWYVPTAASKSPRLEEVRDLEVALRTYRKAVIRSNAEGRLPEELASRVLEEVTLAEYHLGRAVDVVQRRAEFVNTLAREAP